MKIKHLFVFAISFLLLACNQAKHEDKKESEEDWQYEPLSSTQMHNFFPSEIGMTWTYQIEIYGDDFPLQYKETSWSSGNQFLNYSTRSLLRPPRDSDGDISQSKQFALQYKVKAASATQGILKFPDGVELEILKDELGIFKHNKQIFWAIRKTEDFFVNLVVTYSPDSPGAPVGDAFQPVNITEGSMIKLIYFGNKPGLQFNLGGSFDTLYFFRREKDVKGYEGVECLHFQRSVSSGEKKGNENKSKGDDWISKAYSEDSWYVEGKGLVLLEQHVEDKLTMRWSLASVSLTGPLKQKDDVDPAWKEKNFSELSDIEIEASMNITKKVFDEVLGKNLIKYYQSENTMMLKESGYLVGTKNLTKLPKPIVGLSAAYRSNSVNQSLIAKLEKSAMTKEIEWKGIKMSVIKCIVEVIPEGAGEYYDKVTIFPLRMKVIESR